jgi:hypothetical protein
VPYRVVIIACRVAYGILLCAGLAINLGGPCMKILVDREEVAVVENEADVPTVDIREGPGEDEKALLEARLFPPAFSMRGIFVGRETLEIDEGEGTRFPVTGAG